MAARIIDGKRIAAALLEDFAARVAELKKVGVVPGLAAVLVGDDPASAAYVAGKEKDAHSVGMASFVHRLDSSVNQNELIGLVERLNRNEAVHGVIVQMPLPPHLDAAVAQEAQFAFIIEEEIIPHFALPLSGTRRWRAVGRYRRR